MFITLRAARVNRGLTLKDVARLTGKSDMTILKYEKDSTDIPRDLMQKLLEIYDVKYNDVFFGKESDFTEQYKKKLKEVSQ